MTPEYNGDKSEFAALGGSSDTCDKDWDEIMQCFQGVTTLLQFKKANEVAQTAYHSFLGNTMLPIERLSSLVEHCDEKIYLNHEAMITYFYLLYQLDWAKSRNYNIADYDVENGFNGESWVFFEEFMGAELHDEEYMRCLLDDNDFKLWSAYQIQNKLK